MRRSLLLGGMALLMAGCPSGEAEAPVEEQDQAIVVSKLSFVRRDTKGLSYGFDLDGFASEQGGGDGCGIADVEHPETGEANVDNAFSKLLPALEQVGAGPLEDLIQASIDSGELLIVFEMPQPEELVGECVPLTLLRASGPPALGEDEILPGQTFDRNLDIDTSYIACAQFDGTRLTGEGFDLRLMLNVFDEFIDLTLLDARVLVDLEAGVEGRGAGIIGGGLSIDELALNVAGLDGIGDQIPQLIGPLLEVNADLNPDAQGNCQRLSVQLRFETLPAFLFD